MTDVAADAKASAPAAPEEPKLVDAPAEASSAPAADTESASKSDGEAAEAAAAAAAAAAKPELETRADGAADTADVAAAATAAAAAAATTESDAPPAKTDADEKTDGAEPSAAPAPDTPETLASMSAKSSKASTSASRRKSVGQKLNRKASKARITHLDALPGDHYFVKLKGYPAWPVIICDEDMLPPNLVKSRPVSAARQDGTYREDYADGGKRAADRTFPVMYLFTNEFGWVPNQDMHDLDPSKVLDAVNDKMRKDLQHAHKLAAESNPLSYYKDMLRQYKEDLERSEEAKRLAQATPKKPKKAAAADKDGDVDMLDVPMDDDEEAAAAPKKAKKRKADEDTRTPQRSDSVKKPKIKITSSGTPKSTNGTPTTKGGSTKSKPKKTDATVTPAPAPSEPEMSLEERLRRKTKEVYFLRHRIQKSLLTRDQEPKAEEMKLISDYLSKLESFANLEVVIIRETKINKVLKAILKLESIPREDEFKFKSRSHTLLDKWSKRLAAEPEPEAAAAAAREETNGASTNGHAEAKDATTNGAKDEEAAAAATEDVAEAKEGEAKPSEAVEAESEPPKEMEEPKEEPVAVEATA